MVVAMLNRRRPPAGFAAAVLLAALASAPAAIAAPGVAPAAVAPLASSAQRPFLKPRPRPTEGRGLPTEAPDEETRNSYSVPEARLSPACDANFCVHWVSSGVDAPNLKDSDGDGIPDYVERVLRVAEHVHEVENEKLGWREPKSDGTLGGGEGKTDIYLAEMEPGLFGYTDPDTGQATPEHRLPRRLHGYLTLDNDYSPFEFPHTSQTRDLEVTLAHEYNHVLQLAYDAFQDPWFAESTATWMEDQVYNGINDYLRYIPRWVRHYDRPLTGNTPKDYGSVVWNQWLAHRYGRAIVRKAWAGAIHARPGGFAVNAYERAIREAGSSTFGQDFTLFAADVPEWRTGEGFRESRLFEDMPRQGSLPLDGNTLTRRLNHTTFTLLRLHAPTGKAVVVRLQAPRGVETGLALVGRVGGPFDGHAVKRVDFHRGGGALTVRLPDPGRFSRITAVVVNADAHAGGYSSNRLDWNYSADRLPFEISGKLVRWAPGTVATSSAVASSRSRAKLSRSAIAS
jgi:Family of unknown function (DUF6055)